MCYFVTKTLLHELDIKFGLHSKRKYFKNFTDFLQRIWIVNNQIHLLAHP